MEERIRKFLIEDFNFKPPKYYNGGCKKSDMHRFCYRIKPDGKLGNIQENCENWDICKGEKRTFNLNE